MRLAAFLLVFSSVAYADVTFRGNYWRDRNTRVLMPQAELSKELPSGTVIGARYLLDAITSASVASGAIRDEPFTELRHEAGFTIGQRVGRALMTAGYSYGTESDYWAHLITVGTAIELFKKNTLLNFNMAYGINDVAVRMGPTVFNPVGGLQTFNFIAGVSQIFSQTILGTLEYQVGVLGFGDSIGSISGTPNIDTGFQGNPYRTINVQGSPVREQVPFQRVRHAISGSLHFVIPTENRVVPYLGFRPAYRFYIDDWSVQSHTPELRFHLPVGPVEFRLGARYYFQTAASFANEIDGRPGYTGAAGKRCTGCLSSASTGLFYTSDPKLYESDAVYVEARLALSLAWLGKYKRFPAGAWLSGGAIEIMYGHYFNTRVPHLTFGDADLAGLQFSFPL